MGTLKGGLGMDQLGEPLGRLVGKKLRNKSFKQAGFELRDFLRLEVKNSVELLFEREVLFTINTQASCDWMT